MRSRGISRSSSARRKYSASLAVPGVLITSATTVSPKRLAEFGCAGYLPKPFPLETLVATLERLLSAKEES